MPVMLATFYHIDDIPGIINLCFNFIVAMHASNCIAVLIKSVTKSKQTSI